MFDPGPPLEHSRFFEPKFIQGLRPNEPVREGEASPDAPLAEGTLEQRTCRWSPVVNSWSEGRWVTRPRQGDVFLGLASLEKAPGA